MISSTYKLLFSIIAAACLIALAWWGVAHFNSGSQPGTADVPSFQQASYVATSSLRAVPNGMHEYRSVQYGFSLLYPQELAVKAHPGPEETMTITFQNAVSGRGFQMFILPYREDQVTEERFRKDVPTGVRTALTDVTLGGATGAAFYSTDLALGPTYEVWFIKNGYLYEVTTLKPLDTWLQPILETWQFI